MAKKDKKTNSNTPQNNFVSNKSLVGGIGDEPDVPKVEHEKKPELSDVPQEEETKPKNLDHTEVLEQERQAEIAAKSNQIDDKAEQKSDKDISAEEESKKVEEKMPEMPNLEPEKKKIDPTVIPPIEEQEKADQPNKSFVKKEKESDSSKMTSHITQAVSEADQEIKMPTPSEKDKKKEKRKINIKSVLNPKILIPIGVVVLLIVLIWWYFTVGNELVGKIFNREENNPPPPPPQPPVETEVETMQLPNTLSEDELFNKLERSSNFQNPDSIKELLEGINLDEIDSELQKFNSQ